MAEWYHETRAFIKALNYIEHYKTYHKDQEKLSNLHYNKDQ